MKPETASPPKIRATPGLVFERLFKCVALEYSDRLLEGDSALRSVFEAGLTDSHTAYWSLEGLVRVAGSKSYSQLVSFALDSSQETEHRSKAIRESAIHSGQQFIRGLPSDPGKWKDEQLPLEELRQWAAEGFLKGPGFQSPKRHPNLDVPESALDFAASRLDAKLAKYRREQQDITNPTN